MSERLKHMSRMRRTRTTGIGPRFSIDAETGEIADPLGIRPGVLISILKHHIEQVAAGEKVRLRKDVLEMIGHALEHGWYRDPVTGRQAWVHGRPFQRLTKLWQAFTDLPPTSGPYTTRTDQVG